MNWRRLFERMQPTVFFGSAVLTVAFVLFFIVFTQPAAETFRTAQSFILDHFGWFYILVTNAFLIFAVWLMFGGFGHIRLGGEEAEPEFGYLTWLTMLFAAGMGTGLVFWGVAEPMSHYLEPPEGEAKSPEALKAGLRYSFFHWGLHPWAIYIVFGLSIAYFHFRHHLPLAPRSLLFPLIGERIHGVVGHIVDILAVVGTLFGVATSLGLGAIQINTGITRLWNLPQGTGPQVFLIVLITVIAAISVVTGLRHGIRRLSEFNLILAAVLFLFVLIAGPTVYLLVTFVSSIGDYLQQLPSTIFRIDHEAESGWQHQWTLFYWSWWISWSPFVGIFIARISKGRTIREFVATVLLLPTLITFLWFSGFGGTALWVEEEGSGGLAEVSKSHPGVGLHLLLEQFPLSSVTLGLVTLLVVVFFVTSSDSGSLVDAMLTSGADPDPPTAQRVFWAVSEGAVAAVLLAAGGLEALRMASLTSGFPMALFLVVACIGLIKALRVDERTAGVPETSKLGESVRPSE